MLNLHCLSMIKKSTEFQSLNVSKLKSRCGIEKKCHYAQTQRGTFYSLSMLRNFIPIHYFKNDFVADNMFTAFNSISII